MTKFHKGTSGSGKHTEVSARDIGGREPAARSFSAGPGKAGARVRPEIDVQVTRSGGNGAATSDKGLSVYKAGSAPPKGYRQ